MISGTARRFLPTLGGLSGHTCHTEREYANIMQVQEENNAEDHNIGYMLIIIKGLTVCLNETTAWETIYLQKFHN